MAGIEDTLGQLLSNPEAMGQIMAMAQNLGLGPPPEPAGDAAPPPPPAVDARLLGILGRLLSDQQENDPRQQALLTALKPFVRPERRASIDRALQIARLSRLAGNALRVFGKEGGTDV